MPGPLETALQGVADHELSVQHVVRSFDLHGVMALGTPMTSPCLTPAAIRAAHLPDFTPLDPGGLGARW